MRGPTLPLVNDHRPWSRFDARPLSVLLNGQGGGGRDKSDFVVLIDGFRLSRRLENPSEASRLGEGWAAFRPDSSLRLDDVLVRAVAILPGHGDDAAAQYQ